MKDITILGGSGYVGSNLIREYKSKRLKYKWDFYARRESEGMKLYQNTKDIPSSNVIIDFSQRSTMDERLSKLHIREEERRMMECLDKCACYIYISTANINMEKMDKNRKGSIYTNYKRHFEGYLEKMDKRGKKVCIVRVPIIFGDRPKKDTVIEKILREVKGDTTTFKNISSKITAIHTEDLTDKLEYVVEIMQGNKKGYKRVLISERCRYTIKDVIAEAKTRDGSKSNTLMDNEDYIVKGEILDKDDCFHVRLEEKKFCAKIRKLANRRWYI